jgi:hypothetical protein
VPHAGGQRRLDRRAVLGDAAPESVEAGADHERLLGACEGAGE